MNLEDLEPAPKQSVALAAKDLSMLGIAELKTYVGELEAEICRVQAEIAKKQSHRAAADAFFK